MVLDQIFGESFVVGTKKTGSALVFSKHGVESVPNGFDPSQMSWPEYCSLEDLNTSAKSVVKSTYVNNDVPIDNLIELGLNSQHRTLLKGMRTVQ
jgi:peptide methionine sulfoxide reductase MsrA